MDDRPWSTNAIRPKVPRRNNTKKTQIKRNHLTILNLFSQFNGLIVRHTNTGHGATSREKVLAHEALQILGAHPLDTVRGAEGGVVKRSSPAGPLDQIQDPLFWRDSYEVLFN